MSVLFLLILSVLHLAALSQLKFTIWPEILSYPYLLLNNFLPYKDFILPYPPGLVFGLGLLYKILGISDFSLKIITWTWIIATDAMVYAILLRNVKNTVAALFLLLYIILQSFLDGNQLWFDYAMLFPLLTSFWLFIKWSATRNSRILFLMGLSMGMALIIKQTTVIYTFLILIYMAYLLKNKIIDLKDFLLGLFIPPFIVLIYLLYSGSTSYFFNWVIYYPISYWPKFPGYVQFLITPAFTRIALSLLLPSIGVLLVLKKKVKNLPAVLFYLAAGLIAVYPRFSYFHLQPALAFLIIFYAIIFENINSKLKYTYLILFIPIFLFINRLILPFQVMQSPTVDSQVTFIKALSQKKDRVFLVNVSSDKFVYSGTLPSRPWADNFGWYLEIPSIQESVIKGIEMDAPRYVFRQKPLDGNWFDLGVYEPKKILEYIKSNYTKIEEKDNMEVWQKNTK